MKSYILATACLILVACTPTHKHNQPIQDSNLTPSSINAKQIDIGSYSRSGNEALIDRLFKEALSSDPQLQDAVDRIKALKSVIAEEMEKIDHFLDVNKEYSEDISRQLNYISNDELKNKLAMKLDTMLNNYRQNHQQDLEQKQSALQKLRNQLDDHLIYLKLSVTEKMMLNYQNNEHPDISKIDEIAKEVEKIVSFSTQ